MNIYAVINSVSPLLKHRFVHNTGWIITARIIQMALAFVISLITARYLGPSNFGILNYTQSFVVFFTPICTLGLNGIIVKEILDRPQSVGQTIGTMIGLRLLSSFFSMGCILVIVYFINHNPLFVWVAFLQAFMLIFQSFDSINYWYQSKLFSKRTAFISLAGYTSMCLYRILMLVLHKDVTWFAFAVSLDFFVIALLLAFYYFKDGGQKFSFSWMLGKQMLGKSYHFILSGLMVVIYGQMDKIMLGKLLNDTAVGYYSAALSLCNAWPFVLAALIDSARPLIMAVHKQKNIYYKRLRQLYAIILWIGIAVSICITVAAPLIIKLAYGQAYLATVLPLQIITWYTSFSYLGVARNIWMVCENKQRYEKVLAGVGALTNLTFNFLLIPCWGIVGAAIATLLTQMITNFFVLFAFKATRENALLIWDALRFKDIFPLREKII